MSKSSMPEGETPAALPVYAAIDVGTNNCRMLIARPLRVEIGHHHGSLRVLDSFSRIVRLGEGIHAHGKLSNAAMQRALEALEECSNRLREHAIYASRYVTTEACRVAQNSQAFLEQVYARTGIRLEVLEQHEEAQLAFRGCVSLLQPETEMAMVVDIGGGSTEVLWAEVMGDAQKVKDWLSMPWGVMSLTEKFRPGKFVDIPFDEVVAYIQTLLEPLEARNRIRQQLQARKVQMLCTSGTVTTLAAIHLDLHRYNRKEIDGLQLTQAEVLQAIQAMRGMSQSERCTHPCIGPDRADYILGGCAILQAILQSWPVEGITIADRGLREGIVMELMHQHAS